MKLIIPCKDNHLYRLYGGRRGGMDEPYSDGWHLGKDYGCLIGTPVYAPVDLYILDMIYANGYGSMNPHTKGWVIFANGVIDGKMYNFNFGHVFPKVELKQNVKPGEIIATVATFKNRKELLPHLHFGIHEDFGKPKAPWGYVQNKEDMKGWINPVSLGLG